MTGGIAVVGAGVVGANVAYALARSGADVVLVEAGTPGALATAASYAWLNSNNVDHPQYHPLRVLGMRAYRDLAAEVGDGTWLHECGNLHVVFTDTAAAALRAKVARKQAAGYPAELLSAAEMRRVEPALGRLPEKPAAVAWYPAEGYIETASLIGALLGAFRDLGGTVLRARAQALRRDGGGRVTGVATSDGEISASQVVLCTGSDTGLLNGAGVHVSLRGPVGASVITAPLPVRLSHLIHLPGLSARPDGNGRILLRSEDIDQQADTATMTLDKQWAAELTSRAVTLLGLGGLDVLAAEVRVAFRPRPPDGFPVIGPVPGLLGAYLVCMHSGVTVGAIAGRLAARELLTGSDEPLLAAFRAGRAITPAADDHEAGRRPPDGCCPAPLWPVNSFDVRVEAIGQSQPVGYGQAGTALAGWAETLSSAHRSDQQGREELQSAASSLGPLGGWLGPLEEIADPLVMTSAMNGALSGIGLMISAAQTVQTSGQAVSAALGQLAGQARARLMTGDGHPALTALDAVVLANEQNVAADGGGDILTAAQLSRASQIMNQWAEDNPGDLQAFEALLAGAKSPEEAAFLMKALAAGNSLSVITTFDKLIQPYGDDPAWLSQHLAVDFSDPANPQNASYDGTVTIADNAINNPVYGDDFTFEPTQPTPGDCVAASTVVAYASLDPVFMLKLTTGDQPGVPGSDSPTQFMDRIHQVFDSQYVAAQHADGHKVVYPKFTGGIGSTGETLLANSDLGKATGALYSYVSLNSSADNQAVLPKIEQAVQAGQPVPIDVGNGVATGPHANNHQVVIVGQSGDKFEIYNPEGNTGWVTTQQFVSNKLGSVTENKQWEAFAVELPS